MIFVRRHPPITQSTSPPRQSGTSPIAERTTLTKWSDDLHGGNYNVVPLTHLHHYDKNDRMSIWRMHRERSFSSHLYILIDIARPSLRRVLWWFFSGWRIGRKGLKCISHICLPGPRALLLTPMRPHQHHYMPHAVKPPDTPLFACFWWVVQLDIDRSVQCDSCHFPTFSILKWSSHDSGICHVSPSLVTYLGMGFSPTCLVIIPRQVTTPPFRNAISPRCSTSCIGLAQPIQMLFLTLIPLYSTIEPIVQITAYGRFAIMWHRGIIMNDGSIG